VTFPWLLFSFSNRLDMIGKELRDLSKIVMALALDSLKLRSEEVMAPDTLTENVDGKEVVVLLDEYVLNRKKPNELFNQFAKILSDFVENDLKNRLVVVPDELIRIFLKKGIRIQQRVKLTDDKTVEQGGLWGEEHIPPDTIMHFSLICSEGRVKVDMEKLLDLIKLAGSAKIDIKGNYQGQLLIE